MLQVILSIVYDSRCIYRCAIKSCERLHFSWNWNVVWKVGACFFRKFQTTAVRTGRRPVVGVDVYMEVSAVSLSSVLVFTLFPEWRERRTSGAYGWRRLHPPPSGRWEGVSIHHGAVQGGLHPSSAAVGVFARGSVRPAGWPRLWEIRHLRTLERHASQHPQAARDATLSSKTWIPAEQGPVYNRHPLGPGEHKSSNQITWLVYQDRLFQTK